MKKNIAQSRKGQNLVEFVIIGALVSVAALVFLSPLASNVKSQFYKVAPQKSTNVATISNQSTAGLSVKEASAIASYIKSNNSEQISDENLLKVVNSIAKNSGSNNSETSGSIANLITQSSLTTEDKDILAKLKEQSVSLSIKPLTPLAISSNAVAYQIKEEINAGKISEKDLSLMGIDINSLEITVNTKNPLVSFVNILNAADYLVNQKKASAELISKFDDLKLQTKKSLT